MSIVLTSFSIQSFPARAQRIFLGDRSRFRGQCALLSLAALPATMTSPTRASIPAWSAVLQRPNWLFGLRKAFRFSVIVPTAGTVSRSNGAFSAGKRHLGSCERLTHFLPEQSWLTTGPGVSSPADPAHGRRDTIASTVGTPPLNNAVSHCIRSRPTRYGLCKRCTKIPDVLGHRGFTNIVNNTHRGDQQGCRYRKLTHDRLFVYTVHLYREYKKAVHIFSPCHEPRPPTFRPLISPVYWGSPSRNYPGWRSFRYSPTATALRGASSY